MSEANLYQCSYLRLTVSNGEFPMRWATLNFGKHASKTLPEIILSDADWFFWACDKGVFKGRLANEAAELVQKARAIKIPKRRPENWQVEYSYDDTGAFCGFRFVGADIPWPCGRRSIRRSPYLDLLCVRRGKPYDKRGCRNLLRDFRYHYFGDNKRLTKRRCEQFFSNKRNFLSPSS
jgi:hypothetical protein